MTSCKVHQTEERFGKIDDSMKFASGSNPRHIPRKLVSPRKKPPYNLTYIECMYSSDLRKGEHLLKLRLCKNQKGHAILI